MGTSDKRPVAGYEDIVGMHAFITFGKKYRTYRCNYVCQFNVFCLPREQATRSAGLSFIVGGLLPFGSRRLLRRRPRGMCGPQCAGHSWKSCIASVRATHISPSCNNPLNEDLVGNGKTGQITRRYPPSRSLQSVGSSAIRLTTWAIPSRNRTPSPGCFDSYHNAPSVSSSSASLKNSTVTCQAFGLRLKTPHPPNE